MSAARLRIGVDGRAFASPAGGVRRYAWEVYAAIGRMPDVEVIAIGAMPGDPLPGGVQARTARAFPTNLGWMAVSIPLAVRGARLDVFHAPAYTAPLWGVHPQVVTIHDVSPVRRPEWDAYRNDPVRRYFYRRAALSADRVITDSAFSRDEIVAAYGIPARSIDVVPLASADTFTPGPADLAALPPRVRPPFALHVGDLQVRRNLATALDAILGIRRAAGDAADRPTLVCVGVDRGIGSDLLNRARQAGDPDALVLTGTVDDAALLNLYRAAALLVYPSQYEGFGLPVLEAMRCGVPVVAARCASIPEVAGDAAILLDPLDTAAWQRAISNVLTDPAEAARMRAASLSRASLFSWAATAQRTLDVLRRCAAGDR